MSAEPSSLEKAIEAEAGGLLGVLASPEQLDLLRGEDGKLPADAYRRMRASVPAKPGRPKGSLNKRNRQIARILSERSGGRDPLLAMADDAYLPLDQFVELMMIADGSREREERLFTLAERTQRLVDRLFDDADAGIALSDKQFERLGSLVEQVSNLTRTLKVKPGELGLKAYVAQRDTRRILARYIHSEMPVAVDVTTKADVILNIPGLTDAAHLAEYTDSPELTEADVNRLEHVPFGDVEDGEFEDVDGEGER